MREVGRWSDAKNHMVAQLDKKQHPYRSTIIGRIVLIPGAFRSANLKDTNKRFHPYWREANVKSTVSIANMSGTKCSVQNCCFAFQCWKRLCNLQLLLV